MLFCNSEVSDHKILLNCARRALDPIQPSHKKQNFSFRLYPKWPIIVFKAWNHFYPPAPSINPFIYSHNNHIGINDNNKLSCDNNKACK